MSKYSAIRDDDGSFILQLHEEIDKLKTELLHVKDQLYCMELERDKFEAAWKDTHRPGQ